jgi:hypothetical protein
LFGENLSNSREVAASVEMIFVGVSMILSFGSGEKGLKGVCRQERWRIKVKTQKEKKD